MNKLIFAFIVCGITFSFANPMCVTFCTDCKEKNDATCAKIDSTCSCTVLLDSLRSEEERIAQEQEKLRIEAEKKLALQKMQIQKIANALIDSCQNIFCAFEIFTEGDTLKKIQNAMLPIGRDSLINLYLQKNAEQVPVTNSLTNTPEEKIVLPPMNKQCKEFCTMCPLDPVAKVDSSQVATCTKIEEQCQCKSYAELLVKQQEQQRLDSIKAVEEQLLYMETAKQTAELIFNHCNAQAKCSTLVTLRKKNLAVVEFRPIPTKELQKSVSAVTKTPITKPESQNPKQKNTAIKQKPKKPREENHKEKKTFYSGLSLNFGNIDRKVYDIFASFNQYSDEEGYIGGLGYLARWYFYSAGSIQLGINALVESVTLTGEDYEDYNYYGYADFEFEMNQINLIAEIPLELRFGIPLAEWFAPFVSVSFNFRKYIYGWYEYDIGASWNIALNDWYFDGYGYEDSGASDNGFYEAYDWDILSFWGLGIEFTKHFSIQWQWLFGGCGWRSGDEYSDFETDDVYRFSMDFAF